MNGEGLLLIGLGAQLKYAAESAARLGWRVLGAVALQEKFPTEFAGVAVLGPEPALPEILKAHPAARCVLCMPDPRAKLLKAGELAARSVPFTFVMHPAAVVASSAQVAPGAIINAGAIVQPFASIGAHCMVHAGAVVEHDCELSPCSVVSPNATLCGHVRLGPAALVGAGAVVVPGVTLGEGAVVGAGAVVRADIPAGEVWAGVPARRIEMQGAVQQ